MTRVNALKTIAFNINNNNRLTFGVFLLFSVNNSKGPFLFIESNEC